MEKRRDRVLGFLKGHGPASLAEIAAHLEISKQGALRHLDSLLASGLVERRPELPAGPGRPEHVFRLTAAAEAHFPRAHRELAGDLVKFMAPADLERFFAERSARVAAAIAPRLEGQDLATRVRLLAEMAAESGHMTEVKDNGDGSFVIRHCNCPIADVAAQTGHPCHRELAMYETLLGSEVERTTWLANADADCSYVVRSR